MRHKTVNMTIAINQTTNLRSNMLGSLVETY